MDTFEQQLDVTFVAQSISELYAIVCSIQNIVKGTSNDFRCAFERFLTTIASETGRVGLTDDDLKVDNPIYMKFMEEIKCEGNLIKAHTDKFLLEFRHKEIAFSNPDCNRKTFVCSYAKFSHRLPEEIFNRYGWMDNETILRALLRIAALNPGGQQWAMPVKWFEAIERRTKLSLVAYASILNCYPGVPYCSPFVEDRSFGSLGNFHHLDLDTFVKNHDGNITVTINPPFIESILLKASQRGVELLELGLKYKKVVVIVFTGPAWKDAAFFQTCSKSKFIKDSFFLAKGKHYYEAIGEIDMTTIVAKANSQLFVLDNLGPKIKRDYKFLASECKN